MAIYRTSQLARIAKVHPNTIRLYERIGLISPASRDSNGYRSFDEHHLIQVLVCRAIYAHGWLGESIRSQSLLIIRALVAWDLDRAEAEAGAYLCLLQEELEIASETAAILRRWAAQGRPFGEKASYSRKQTAEIIGVTEEALRNWERNGLIEVPRIDANKTRRYGGNEIERLRIIYMLRQAKYSIAAIHNSLQQYDLGNTDGVIPALNNPELPEDASWISVGDRWQESLAAARGGGQEIINLLAQARGIEP